MNREAHFLWSKTCWHTTCAAVLVLSLCLLACTQADDVPGEQSADERAIVFGSNLQGVRPAATRTETSLHDKGIESLRVWGYKNNGMSGSSYTAEQVVMDGYDVQWQTTLSTTNSDNWEYVNGTTQTPKYWDYAARAYRFMGIAPADASHTAAVTGTTEKSLNVTITADGTDEAATPYYSELWLSNNDAGDYPDRLYGQTVQLRFVKPLAYVRFMFTFAKGVTQYTHDDLRNISFAPTDGSKVGVTGLFTISYPLTGTATDATWSVGTPTGTLDALTKDYYESGAEPEYWNKVLPVGTQGSYTLHVNIIDEERTTVVPAHLMNWQPGYEYTYVFKIIEGRGVVLDLLEMALREWSDDPSTRVHYIYNW